MAASASPADVGNAWLPGGRLVVHLDHQDVGWLGGLRGGQAGVFGPERETVDPAAGRRVRVSRAWSYQPSTQTAEVRAVWSVAGPDGAPVDRWETGPLAMHCVFRFEMVHLLARVGLEVEGLYGDFRRGELRDESTEMVWVARKHG